MSFVVGGLFINESVEVVKLRRVPEDWDDTLCRVLEAGVISSAKTASKRRTLREIANRLSTLSDREILYISERADQFDKQALLWLAACRAYRFIREFAIEVLQERFLVYRLDLPLDSFDVFFNAKAEWNDDLEAITPLTRKKLRQVMFRMMREASILTDKNRIQRAYVSPKLQGLIKEENPGELGFFPGLLAGES